MKKILVTLDFPPEIGGIQRYLHEIVLHTFHQEDVVLASGNPMHTADTDTLYPCPIRRVRLPFTPNNKKLLLLPMLLTLTRIILQNKTDITIVSGNVYAALLPYLISRILPVAYQVYCYGTELMSLQRRHSVRAHVWKAVLRHADTVFYLTDATKNLLVQSCGDGHYQQNVPKIDCPVFSIADKHPKAGMVNLLSVGRLVPHKGHAFLIQAVNSIDTTIAWHLTIVGSGPEQARLAAMIRANMLEHRCTLQTTTSDQELSSLYMTSDILILPSIETAIAVEGFGIVLLEAMAYGVAIIASRSGGIPAVFEGAEECAVLVPPKNPEALCSAITALSLDISRRQNMIKTARCLLERRYVWE
jgi:glycosyltransferase involved in cell wall biosynthesis